MQTEKKAVERVEVHTREKRITTSGGVTKRGRISFEGSLASDVGQRKNSRQKKV